MNKMPKNFCIILLVLISSSFCFIDEEIYNEIKSKATFEVMDKEEHAKLFEGITYESLSYFKGKNHLISKEVLENLEAETTKSFLALDQTYGLIALPLEFDWRREKPECFSPIKNQKNCGSCYSFSVTAALETRICLALQGRVLPELSQQDIISCDAKNNKCSGDTLDNTWKYLENVGTCNYWCKPYVSADGYIPQCSESCSNKNFTFARWRAVPGTWRINNNPRAIKSEVYFNGPVSAGMETFEDFTTYKGGIYIHAAGKATDHHAVTIVGWGFDLNYQREYWIIRNSWGDAWGEAGYFKILFGMYEIDSFANASSPLI